MRIIIETIPHNTQRYPTIGDWIIADNGDVTIKISEMGDWRYEMAVAYHELREILVCKWQGITQKEVDEFDISFEKIRELYPDIIGDQEPGDMISAPYNTAHVRATRDERGLIEDLGVNWTEYEDAINKMA